MKSPHSSSRRPNPLPQWLISAGAGAAFVADGLLTGVLVNLLHRQRTGVKRWVLASTPSPLSTEADHPPDREHSMDRVVDTLILYSVNTGTRAYPLRGVCVR